MAGTASARAKVSESTSANRRPAGGPDHHSRDITELLEKENLYDAIPGMVVVMDTDHTILDLNRSAADAVKKRKQDCVGLKFWDLFDNEACRAGTCPASLAVKTGTFCEGEAVPLVDGKEVPVLVTANPLFNEMGQVAGVVELIFPAAGDIGLFREIDKVAEAARQGRIDARIEPGLFQGRHLERAKAINVLLTSMTERATEATANTKAVAQVMTSVADTKTVDEAVQEALKTVRAAFNWEYGSYWLLDPQEKTMRCTVESGAFPAELRQIFLGLRVKEGEGMLGKAWKSRDMFFVQDIASLEKAAWAELATKVGVKSGIAFPITANGEVAGVLDFFAMQTMHPSADRMEALHNVGHLLASAIERIAGEEKALQTQKALQEGVLAIGQTAESLSSAAEELTAISQQMASNAEETSAQANVVSAAAAGGQQERADGRDRHRGDERQHQGDRQERPRSGASCDPAR